MKKTLKNSLSFISLNFKTKIVMLAFSATFISCNKDALEVKKLTFQDIETEFNFKKPLSEFTRTKILEKFGTVENYRIFVQNLKQSNLKNKDFRSIYVDPNQSDSLLNSDSILAEVVYFKSMNKIKNAKSAVYLAQFERFNWGGTPLSPHGFAIRDNEYILDAAESAGFDLPYSCRAGACSTCVCKCISGRITVYLNTFLDDDQINYGYFPACVAEAESDIKFLSHQEANLY